MAEKNTPERIELVSREGRPYATTDPVEASHLRRTRGYRLAEEADEPAGGDDGKPEGGKPRTGGKPAGKITNTDK